MWLTDYNRAGDALPINLVMTKKHIEKEGQNLLHKVAPRNLRRGFAQVCHCNRAN